MNSSVLLKGCGTALVTPFHEDGSVDYERYAALVDRQVAAGIDFLVPLGTSGETPTLSKEEKLELYRITREHSKGLPIIVGAGSNSVPATLENIEMFPGADAYLIVVPFYNKPTQEGMYLYYKTIAEKSGVPVVIYNVPGRTGSNITAETTLRIAREVKGIVGIKEASGKIEQVREIIAGAPDGFSVLSGDDDMTLEIIQAGGNGVISVASNVLPDKVAAMCGAALKGDMAAAEEMDRKLNPLFKGCFVESNPIPAKAALARLGLSTKTMRLPLTPANPATEQTIKEILDAWK